MKIKLFIKWCNEYRERWNKASQWDSYCLVSDAWMNGFYKGREEVIKSLIVDDPDFGKIVPPEVVNIGEEIVEVPEIHNQTGMEDKYSKMSIEDKLKRDVGKFYRCDDFRVNVSEDGRVSFQGSFKQ